MLFSRLPRIATALAVALALAGCGGGFSGLGGGQSRQQADVAAGVNPYDAALQTSGNAGQDQIDAYIANLGESSWAGNEADIYYDPARKENTIWALFGGTDTNTTVEVNKYIWLASLDVLNFLPVESVDPFTGVIVTGYGTPPGGGRSYRATIYINDPALDARSLRVAMQARGGGAVAPETIKAVEDAILSRARQLRIQDTKL